ncbi:hypothetical protein D3C85_1516960 [compost metagenome]
MTKLLVAGTEVLVALREQRRILVGNQVLKRSLICLGGFLVAAKRRKSVPYVVVNTPALKAASIDLGCKE